LGCIGLFCMSVVNILFVIRNHLFSGAIIKRKRDS
jgi:hypothetical protein